MRIRISGHAALRLRERTKLKKFEFQTILDKSAFVVLEVYGQKQYILFYDARGDEFFVAIIRDNTVMSIIYLWQRMHKNVKAGATEPKMQKQAEDNFNNRAAALLHPGLQVGLNVFVSFEKKLGKKKNTVVVPEEYVHRIDSLGFQDWNPILVKECFAEEISRILMREISEANVSWKVCVTFRKLNGRIAQKYVFSLGEVIGVLPLYGAVHEVNLHVQSGAEKVKLELGSIDVNYSLSPWAIIANLHKQFLQLFTSVEDNYSPTDQLRFRYIIELQNKRLSWNQRLPAMSHFELRSYIDPRHSS